MAYTLLSPSRPWYQQRWPIIVAGFIAAFLSGLLIAISVKSQGDWSHGLPWEREMLISTHTRLPAALDALMLILPWFGTNISLMPVIFAIVIWLWRVRKQRNAAMWLLVVQIGSWALNPALKATFDRARPDLFEQRGWFGWSSYPSGHSIASVSVLFTLALIAHRLSGRRWPFFVAGAIAAGAMYSRLYLSVHWPTDVLAGSVVGGVWLWATFVAFRENPPGPRWRRSPQSD